MTFRMLIDGRLVQVSNTINVLNPATGEVITTVGRANAELMEHAVSAAKRASRSWAAIGFNERRKFLLRFADEIQGHFNDLAQTLTEEQGKPLVQARDEVGASIAMIRYVAGLETKDEVLLHTQSEKVIRHRTALGVVVAIAPWNFPMLLMVAKLAPALIAGNTVICKPSPTTPLTTLMLGEIGQGIFPAGVLGTLVDDNDIGPMLTAHPDVAKVSFTGSTAIGQQVMANAAAGIKRVTLELGGNDAAIVLDDADVEHIAPRIFAAATYNAGQVCFATKRVYAPSSMYNALCASLADLANAAVVGDGRDPSTQIGPIQNRKQFAKLQHYLEIARVDGRVIAGGNPIDREGFFIRPTVVRDLPEDSAVVQEEQFGPIIPIIPYDDVDDVITRINCGNFGLGGTIWTSNPERGEMLARKIDSGVVWVNRHLELGFDVPISGCRRSGFGVEHGQEGLESFTQPHIVSIAL